MRKLRWSILFLGLAMILSCSGIKVLASEDNSGTAGNEVPSGTCGDNLTWTLEADGTMIIAGTGAMADYEWDEWSPWYDQRESITSVVIEPGVTRIGCCTFSYCTNLTQVSIPEGVTSIGSCAFYECLFLVSAPLPEGLKTIESSSFAYCYRLEDIQIPNSVTSIGRKAFGDCSELRVISVPEGVTSIEEFAFIGCDDMTSIKLPEGITSIGEGAFQGCTALTSINIPKNVTEIGDRAFQACYFLSHISIPENVTCIGDKTFQYCEALESLKIPAKVQSIGESAFDNCIALKDVYYGGTESDWAGISISSNNNGLDKASIHYQYADIPIAKGTCGDNLTWTVDYDGILTISGTGKMKDYDDDNRNPWSAWYNTISTIVIENGVTSIGTSAFDGCSGPSQVTLPESLISIGKDAFCNCSGLTTISIPASVTDIGANAFDGCLNLTSIQADSGNPKFASLNGALYDKGMTRLIICPGGKTGVYEIPEGVTSIGRAAFNGCKLRGVTIPESLTDMGDYAFYDCRKLISVSIPAGVTGIGTGAFQSCFSLKKVWISTGVQSIASDAFAECDCLETIEVDENNPYVTAVDNVVFNKAMTELIICPCSRKGSYTIPEGVKVIGASAFAGSRLSTVTFPAGLTGIGEHAFTLSNITSAEIPEGVRTISQFAFCMCRNMTSVSIPESITKIGTFAFYGCKNLKDVYYGGSPDEWGSLMVFVEMYNYELYEAEVHFAKESVPSRSLDNADVTGVTDKVYTGKAITQTPVVRLRGKKLRYGTDYTIQYYNNVNVGDVDMVITGIGDYDGWTVANFFIKPKGTTIIKLIRAKKGFTVKWNKRTAQTTGYQIQYCLKSNFKKAKTVTVKKNSITSKKIMKLKAKKKYYVRIRTYKKVGKNRYYSSWSKVKTVKPR